MNLAILSEKLNMELVIFSTRYVFSGNKKTPYVESDKVNPNFVYGESKVQAEEYVASLAHKFYIFRTGGLYNKTCDGFLKFVINILKRKSHLEIFNDQIFTPTLMEDLVKQVALVIEKKVFGLFHATNKDSVSWYEFVSYINTLYDFGCTLKRIDPLKIKNYSLFNQKLNSLNLNIMKTWQENINNIICKEKL